MPAWIEFLAEWCVDRVVVHSLVGNGITALDFADDVVNPVESVYLKVCSFP